MSSNVERAARRITELTEQGRRRWAELTPLLIAQTLADADPPILLPDDAEVTVEWGVRCCGDLYEFRTEKAARAYVDRRLEDAGHDFPGVVRRYHTPWGPVDGTSSEEADHA